jgi:hypothetical protein
MHAVQSAKCICIFKRCLNCFASTIITVRTYVYDYSRTRYPVLHDWCVNFGRYLVVDNGHDITQGSQLEKFQSRIPARIEKMGP